MKMKKIPIAITAITCLSAFKFTDNSKVFKKLYTLEGTWKMITKRGTIICEEWKKVNNDHLQNKGYMIKGTTPS